MKNVWNSTFPFRSLWERYFFLQALKTFILFLFCFYGLYVLIDFSTQLASYHRHHIRFQMMELLRYYASDFLLRLDVLMPFGLLIAVIKTLSGLNSRNELVAMMANGISLKMLMRPFLILGLLCTALVYVNSEFLIPHASLAARSVRESHSSQKTKHSDIPTVQHLLLEDGSTLLFQSYDPTRQMFYDTYWIRSHDDLYRIKFLYPYTETPVGQHVDHFVRKQEALAFAESRPLLLLPEIRFDRASLLDAITQPEELSLSDLKEKASAAPVDLSEKQAQLQSVFYQKLAMPWLCFLAVLAPIPACVRYSRYLPIFMIYALYIFGLVAFYLIIDAAVILSKRQVFSPLWAVALPFTLAFGLFGVRYIRMR